MIINPATMTTAPDWTDAPAAERAVPEPVPFVPEGPQPLVPETAPCAAYPVHALGPLQAVAEAVQGQTQAPVAIPAASALAVAALAVQGFADVETLGGARPVSLFVLTIAQSGERKSSCDSLLMEALQAFEREQARAYRDETQSWQNRHALWKGTREKVLAEAKAGKVGKRTSGEADLAALGAEPAAPPSPQRTVTNPTFQGLTRQFREGQPSLGIFSDEGGQFLGGYAMNSDNRQNTLAALNDAWQGAPIKRTLQGEGSLALYGRRLSIHLMVQPGVARDFMADPRAVDTGFLPRFLICEPSSTIGTRMQDGVRINRPALDAFADRLAAILNTPLPMDPETQGLKPRVLRLAPEARKLLVQFADVTEAAQARGGPLSHVTGYASKAAEQAARIAAVLALWSDLNAETVDADMMANGIELAQFHLQEAARLADAATVSAEVGRAEMLRKWLLECWAETDVVLREILQRGPNPVRENPKARAALALLERNGWVARLPEGTVIRGGARKEAWRIVRRW